MKYASEPTPLTPAECRDLGKHQASTFFLRKENVPKKDTKETCNRPEKQRIAAHFHFNSTTFPFGSIPDHIPARPCCFRPDFRGSAPIALPDLSAIDLISPTRFKGLVISDLFTSLSRVEFKHSFFNSKLSQEGWGK